MDDTSRIKLHMTTQDAIVAMVDGNPGALTVVVEILRNTDHIDPDNPFGGFADLILLDTNRIYGSRIWMLYTDICDRDITKVIAVIRAIQLGIIDLCDVQHAIDNRGNGIDVDAIMAAVQERLPRFNNPDSLILASNVGRIDEE